ncbi:MAG: DEAD (Asp-Glu-Ala-Asp) box polypeptide 52, variant 2 [Marteilia pararefringens]
MLVEQIRCEIDKISSATPIMVQKATNLLNDPNLPLSDILIGTPKDILRFQHSFDGVKYIVVDECDQLFENAKISHYKDQISTILRRCINPQLSHAFFSATFSPKLEKWAQSYFNDPQCIYIGQKNLTNCFVEQSLRFTGSEYGKILELKKLIRQSNTELIPLIIFVQSKPRALDCVVELQREFPTLKTAAIYSSRNRNDHQEKQSAAFDGTEDEERSRVCDEFRSGALDILVATNCLSRGMDFPLLKSVINFDIPTSEKDYIHRVGRASRGGKIGGKSITFFTTPDHPYLYGIAKQIMASGGTIPQYLETLLMGKEDSKNSKPVVPSSGCNIRQNGDKEPRKLGKTSKRYSTIAKQIRRNTKHGIPRRKPFQLPDTVKFI